MRLDKKKHTPEIPTASMADIAFLLIIYFMVTTVFSAKKGMQFELPKDEELETTQAEESIYIQVLSSGQLRVDGNPMALDAILDYIVPKLRINQRKPVIIHPEPSTPYEAMIGVYDELMASKVRMDFEIKTVVIPTQREIQEYIELFGYNPFAVQGG
ncbi:MAG: biopolymer transporter ExbD [Acidobacteria bacterium]|nr:MAG: biopolymer transporter ExbD [Acidobacteriota bacterium]